VTFGDGGEGLEVVGFLFFRVGRLVEFCTSETGNGEELGLFIKLEAFLSFEVYGECGDSQNWAVDSDELGDDVAALLSDHGSTGNGKVSVKPCVPETTYNYVNFCGS